MLGVVVTTISALTTPSIFLWASLDAEPWTWFWLTMIGGATFVGIGGAVCVVEEYKRYQSGRRLRIVYVALEQPDGV